MCISFLFLLLVERLEVLKAHSPDNAPHFLSYALLYGGHSSVPVVDVAEMLWPAKLQSVILDGSNKIFCLQLIIFVWIFFNNIFSFLIIKLFKFLFKILLGS